MDVSHESEASAAHSSSSKKIKKTRSVRPRHHHLTWRHVRKASQSSRIFSRADLKRRSKGCSNTRRLKNQPQQLPPNQDNSMVGDMPEPLNDPPEHSTCTADITPFINPDNELGNGNNQLMDQLREEYKSSKVQIKLSPEEIYGYELKCHQAIAVCDFGFKTFVIQDFSDRTMSLKPNCYNFVYRCGKSFCGEVMWVYWCSCDNKRSQFVDGLSSSVSSTYDLFSKTYPECFHISAIRRIIQESIDGVYDLTPETEFDDHTYACASKPILQDFSESLDLVKVGNDGAICIKSEGGYGVVHQGEKGILCATCQFNKRACPHVLKLVSSINELQPDVPGFLIPLSRALCVEAVKTKEHRDRPLASLQSSRPIPFKFTPALASVLKLPFSERFQTVEGMCHLSDSGHGAPSCSFCGHSEWDTGYPKSTTLITQHQTLASCVYSKQCGNASCDGKAYFDGQNMGLLNMTSFCITYEVLRNHLHQFLNGRTTIFTQYTVLCKSHEDAGNSAPIPYNSYLKAWYGFVHLLDIPYENGFTCRHCGNEPNVIIMDATSLAFRKNLDAWQTLQLLQTDEKQELRIGR